MEHLTGKKLKKLVVQDADQPKLLVFLFFEAAEFLLIIGVIPITV